MKRIIIIVSTVILFVAIILLNGISVTTSDYIFTTKYYKSPQKAFEKENDEVEIEKDIKIYSIDENNCFYIALTNEADLLISKMFTKNDKFFYAGVYALHDLNSIEQKVDKFSDNYYSDSIFDNMCRFFRSSKQMIGCRHIHKGFINTVLLHHIRILF